MDTPATGFLAKAFALVSLEENAEFIRWTGDGLSFTIVAPELAPAFLPRYFSNTDLNHFISTLMTLGFEKLSPEALAFAHPLFRRGEGPLLTSFARQLSGKKRKRPQEEETESPLAKRRCAVSRLRTASTSISFRIREEREKQRALQAEFAASQQAGDALQQQLRVLADFITGRGKKVAAESKPPTPDVDTAAAVPMAVARAWAADARPDEGRVPSPTAMAFDDSSDGRHSPALSNDDAEVPSF